MIPGRRDAGRHWAMQGDAGRRGATRGDGGRRGAMRGDARRVTRGDPGPNSESEHPRVCLRVPVADTSESSPQLPTGVCLLVRQPDVVCQLAGVPKTPQTPPKHPPSLDGRLRIHPCGRSPPPPERTCGPGLGVRLHCSAHSSFFRFFRIGLCSWGEGCPEVAVGAPGGAHAGTQRAGRLGCP